MSEQKRLVKLVKIVETGFFQTVEWDAEVSFASDRSMSFFDPQSLLSSEISNL